MAIRTSSLHTQEAFNLSFRDLMLTKRTALPGVIQAVNFDGSKLISVDVQPAISMSVASEDGYSSSSQAMPVIPDVPVVLPYSKTNGLAVTIPLAVGDECLLVMADRSIDNWQFDGGVQPIVEDTTPRSHELTDAICIPGAIAQPDAIENYSKDAIEIRNKDHGSFLSVKDDEISLTVGSSSITIVDGTITLSADNVIISGSTTTINTANTQVNGDITVTQELDVEGTMTDPNGVSLESHVHSDPQGGTTGPPQN